MTYLFGIVAGACLYVCRLSLFNFEKHASAGRSIAKNDKETQKAIHQSCLSNLFFDIQARKLGPRRIEETELTLPLPIQFICPLILILIFPFPTFPHFK